MDCWVNKLLLPPTQFRSGKRATNHGPFQDQHTWKEHLETWKQTQWGTGMAVDTTWSRLQTAGASKHFGPGAQWDQMPKSWLKHENTFQFLWNYIYGGFWDRWLWIWLWICKNYEIQNGGANMVYMFVKKSGRFMIIHIWGFLITNMMSKLLKTWFYFKSNHFLTVNSQFSKVCDFNTNFNINILILFTLQGWFDFAELKLMKYTVFWHWLR